MAVQLQESNAVNFTFLKKEDLMRFFNQWAEIEVSWMFALSVVISNDGSPHVIQAVPKAKTPDMDVKFFEFLDISLRDGMLHHWGWDKYAEKLPRFGEVAKPVS